jgi:type I restriction enzyme M protein
LDRLINLAESSEQTEVSVSVPSSAIAANDYSLESSRFILDDKARRVAAALREHSFSLLGDHFEIIRPRQHATAARGSNVFEVQTLDLPEFGYLINASKDAMFDLGSPKANTYFLQDKDILLSFRGSIGKVAIANGVPPAGEDGWIAGQSFVILRASKQTNYLPEALVVYLRSEIGQVLLNRMAVGLIQSSIQLSSLKELEIPTPLPDEMNRMVQNFEQEVQIQNEIQQLRDKQAALTASFWCL